MIGKGDPPAARTTINRGNESCRGGGSRLTACRIIALADIRSQLPENRQRLNGHTDREVDMLEYIH